MDKAEGEGADGAAASNGQTKEAKAPKRGWLLPVLVVICALCAELFRELQMIGDPNPNTLLSDDEFKELFDTVFKAGSAWIRKKKAKPLFFSSMDAAGRFGPVRNMKGGPKICKEIGQNKLISAYGVKARSKYSKAGPAPAEAMSRPLLQVLTPPLMKMLVPNAYDHAAGGPIKGWFLRFVNKYRLYYLGWQGAVPVYHAGTGAFVAAFASSGSSGDEDEGAIDIGLAAAGLKRVGARWLWFAPGEAKEYVANKDGFGGEYLYDLSERQEKKKLGGDTPLIGVGGPFTGDKPGNLADWGLVDEIGGALSIMVTLRMDDLNLWGRVFDFSPKPDYDSITVGNYELGFDLYFAIRRGSNGTAVAVPDFFKIDQEVTCLFTVNDDGHMKVWADGELVGEHPAGQTPKFVPRPHLTIAGHHKYPAQGFRGMIENVKVWNKEVSWDVAAATEPRPLRYAYLERAAAKPKLKPKGKPKEAAKPTLEKPAPKNKPAAKKPPAQKPSAKAKGRPAKPAAKEQAAGKGRR